MGLADAASLRHIAVTMFVAIALFAPWPHAALAQDGGTIVAEAQQILDMINARRSEAGLGPLAPDARLHQAAQAHSDDILHHGNYSHWGTDGTLVQDRVIRTGYSNNPWVSENWVSSSSPQSAMTWWMNDYTHRVNILNPRWHAVGIGVSKSTSGGDTIFVTVFSAGRDASAAYEPAVTASSVAGSSAAAAPAVPQTAPAEYAVQQGDTLLGIALRYGYEVDDIATANGIDQDGILQIGQVLRIADALAGNVTSAGVGGLAAGETAPYQVREGETLFSIAARRGLTWQELAAINGLGEGSLLQIGQTIRVPVEEHATAGGEANATAGSANDEALVEEFASAYVNAVEGSSTAVGSVTVVQYHVIREGDTVIGIAERYGMAWGELLAFNGLDDDSILVPGKVLRLP